MPNQPAPIDSFLPLWDKHLLNDDSCPFCQRILNGQYTMFTSTAVAFEPLKPVTRGHLLLVPSVHITSRDSSSLGLTDVASLIRRLTETSVGDVKPDFNLIVNAGPNASQTIDHFHMHYIPRVADDRLKLPWTDGTNGVCEKCGHAVSSMDYQTHIQWYHKDPAQEARCDTDGKKAKPDGYLRDDEGNVLCAHCELPIYQYGSRILGTFWKHLLPYPTKGCIHPEPARA